VSSKDIDEPSGDQRSLAETAWEALSKARLTSEALVLKTNLLKTPFLLQENPESHITGYLLIKASLARARASTKGRFIHDGMLLPILVSLIYCCPELVLLILDETGWRRRSYR
jgi:hypothetical protein